VTMSGQNLVVSLLGFDRALVSELGARSAGRITGLALWGLFPVVSSGASAAYLVWLSEHHLGAALTIGSAVSALVLNLLRLHNAGSGPAPHHTAKDAERWAPGGGAVLVLGLLGALTAQPLLAGLERSAQRSLVQEHRAELLLNHRSQSAADHVTSDAEVVRHLEQCEFVTLRLALTWQQPARPLALTGLFTALYLGPLLLGHLTHLRPLREYQRLRWEQARGLVLSEELHTQVLVARELARWPVPGAPHLVPWSPLDVLSSAGSALQDAVLQDAVLPGAPSSEVKA
jgi:hypothetical protein